MISYLRLLKVTHLKSAILKLISIRGKNMSIPAKKLLKAYLENLNRVLSDPEQLNEAVGWRGIVSEMAWKGQFPKGTAKPDVTLTNLMQHGWIDDAGNITDTFIYNPSETTASGNRYDQERREFYLTHLNTKEQIALASAYFKAGQALIDRYRKKVESSKVIPAHSKRTRAFCEN
jgi:hypothetical protein